MVFFSMSSTIFWIHLQAVVYPKSCYNEHYYKEVVVYIPVPVPYHYVMQMSLSTKKKKNCQLFINLLQVILTELSECR